MYKNLFQKYNRKKRIKRKDFIYYGYIETHVTNCKTQDYTGIT